MKNILKISIISLLLSGLAFANSNTVYYGDKGSDVHSLEKSKTTTYNKSSDVYNLKNAKTVRYGDRSSDVHSLKNSKTTHYGK